MTYASNKMVEISPTVLAGNHIQLVPLSLAHHEQLCQIGLDSRLWEFTTNEIKTREQMLSYIETALNDQRSGTCLPFVIIEKGGGTIVGSSRFHSFNKFNRRVVIGHTWISPNWQRTAVNTEAKYLMLQHAFEKLECARVEFLVNNINLRSQRALLRIGATQEGTMRRYSLGKNGENCDVVLFSITASEWPQVKNALEFKLGGRQVQDNFALSTSYDKVAKDYVDQFADELAHKPFDRRMLDWLIDRVAGLGPICDMGCGPGQVANYLHEHNVETIGIDLSSEMVKQAQLLNPNIRFQRGDMLALHDVADAAFGGIAAFYSIIHIPRDSVVDALVELQRVLKPGGILLVTHHVGSQTVHREEWFDKEVSIDFRFFETQAMKDYIIESGLLLEEVIERDPYVEFEYPSRRSYIFARKK